MIRGRVLRQRGHLQRDGLYFETQRSFRPKTPATGPVRKMEAVHFVVLCVEPTLDGQGEGMEEKGGLAEEWSVHFDARSQCWKFW